MVAARPEGALSEAATAEGGTEGGRLAEMMVEEEKEVAVMGANSTETHLHTASAQEGYQMRQQGDFVLRRFHLSQKHQEFKCAWADAQSAQSVPRGQSLKALSIPPCAMDPPSSQNPSLAVSHSLLHCIGGGGVGDGGSGGGLGSGGDGGTMYRNPQSAQS